MASIVTDSAGPTGEDEGPVTVVIRHKVKVGREADFEVWQQGINRAAMKFEGHLGYHVIRPAAPQGEYLVLFRFSSLANLQRWETSEARQDWLKKAESLTVSLSPWEKHTGMEVWFTPPPGRLQPPRYKLMLVTFLALYPLIILVQATLGPQMFEWPLVLRTLVTTPILIVFMTYGAMPFVTKLLTRWLYPNE